MPIGRPRAGQAHGLNLQSCSLNSHVKLVRLWESAVFLQLNHYLARLIKCSRQLGQPSRTAGRGFVI